MEDAGLFKKIGEILASRQTELGLSLRQIENLSGVSRMSVSRILNGNPAASIEKLVSVAQALDLKIWKVIQQAEKEVLENTVL